jgi:hypothetical protein
VRRRWYMLQKKDEAKRIDMYRMLIQKNDEKIKL